MDPLVDRLKDLGYETTITERKRKTTVMTIARNDSTYRVTFREQTRYIEPWIELVPDQTLSPDNDDDIDLITCCADQLVPGSHIMIQYTDSLTAEALNIDIPPPATPIGHLLFINGFTWFKDWYIAEGWREGGQKLQANKPRRTDHLTDLRSDLRTFLDDPYGPEKCQKLAQQALDQL